MELKNRSRRHFFWNTVYINIHWTNPVLWKSFGRCAPWKRLAVDCARRRRSRLCRRFCSSTGSLRHGRLPSGSGLSRPSERCRSAGQPTCHRATEWAQITGRFGDEFVRAVNTQKHQKKTTPKMHNPVPIYRTWSLTPHRRCASAAQSTDGRP